VPEGKIVRVSVFSEDKLQCFVRRFLGEKEGAIIELETGKKLGTHRGYWFHTIGQRKGLGLSGCPWFVVKKVIEE
jgi:tRNA-specific 2-thiouridylase